MARVCRYGGETVLVNGFMECIPKGRHQRFFVVQSYLTDIFSGLSQKGECLRIEKNERKRNEMKKAVIMAMTLLMILAVCASALAAGGSLTLEQAKQAALDYAGVSTADAFFTKTEKDWDDGREIYEIEFYVGGTEYEMDVDAATGNITEFSKEYHEGVNYGGTDSKRTGFSAGENPTMEQAKQAALDYAGVSGSDATFTKTGKDRDDGREVYEIEFYAKGTEYDFDIDVRTGKIVHYDVEYHGNRDNQPEVFAAGNSVTVEEVKQAALNYAGVSASNARFTKAGTDWDDGREVYEIEFYADDTEYDMDIEAGTGRLLSFKIEHHGR